MSALNAAKAKLVGSSITFVDLPQDINSTLWPEIRNECHLTLGEISALQNAVCHRVEATAPAAAAVTSLGYFEKPKQSASAIANKYPGIYDVFAHVCQPGTYIPNERARTLLHLEYSDEHTINILCMEIMEKWDENDSFRPIPLGSETMLSDLNLQHVLQIIPPMFPDPKLSVLKCTTTAVSNYLQRGMAAEHCYNFKFESRNYVVVGTEAKGLEASIRQCYPQLIALCGSAAIELVRRGVSIEDAVVPGIAFAAGGIQICLIYLLKPCFPVLVAVTNVLNPLGSFEDQKLLAKWLLKCYLFGKRTAEIFIASTRVNSSMNKATLDTEQYFFKPVREGLKVHGQRIISEDALIISTQSSSLNYTMRVYETLHSTLLGPMKRNLFLFPCGVITGIGEDSEGNDALKQVIEIACKRTPNFQDFDIRFKPIILFPLLVDYVTVKPPLRVRDSYREKLAMAIECLNTAGIAHLDLRPDNIMWKENEDGTTVDMKIIDFETAVLFKDAIPRNYVTTMASDVEGRYPFNETTTDVLQYQFADQSHNDFFLEFIAKWLDSDIEIFDSFMLTRKRPIEEEEV